MHVIPYFLPDERPSGEAGSAPAERPYFLFVGRLEKIKGVQDILPAFAGASGPDLLIIGTGDYEAALRGQAAGQPRVKFLGKLAPEALSRYYERAIALIVPSVSYETFGIILIEAFRKGTPVIARRIGPFPEIVARGGGVLFSDGAELHEALGRLHDDPAYRRRIAREARTAFDTHWREEVVLERYFDLLRGTALAKGDARVLSALGG
jgi:glycosyltransferase involved in cell wall biosynthesis